MRTQRALVDLGDLPFDRLWEFGQITPLQSSLSEVVIIVLEINSVCGKCVSSAGSVTEAKIMMVSPTSRLGDFPLVELRRWHT